MVSTLGGSAGGDGGLGRPAGDRRLVRRAGGQQGRQRDGVFTVVIGLLVWLSLLARALVIGAEVNAVLRFRLWPRALLGPPMDAEPTAADLAVYSSKDSSLSSPRRSTSVRRMIPRQVGLADPHALGDLGLGQVLEEPQPDDLTLTVGQRVEQLAHHDLLIDVVVAGVADAEDAISEGARIRVAAHRLIRARGLAGDCRRRHGAGIAGGRRIGGGGAGDRLSRHPARRDPPCPHRQAGGGRAGDPEDHAGRLTWW